MKTNEIKQQLLDARDEYIQRMKAELIGPGSENTTLDREHELISSNPISRYSIGILYPQGNQVDPYHEKSALDEEEPTDAGQTIDDIEDNENVEMPSKSVHAEALKPESDVGSGVESDTGLDEEINLSAQYMPSSMGLTFLTQGGASVVHGRVYFATYRHAKIHDCVLPFTPDDPAHYAVPAAISHKFMYDKERGVLQLLSQISSEEVKNIFDRDNIFGDDTLLMKNIAYRFVTLCGKGFVRIPHTAEFTLDFSHGNYIDNQQKLDDTNAKITAFRKKIADNVWSLTIMLVNDLVEAPAMPQNCLFQSRLEIDSALNNFVFKENDLIGGIDAEDEEEQSLALLYRNKKIYGTGLGISTDWNIDANGKGRLWTEAFPQTEVPPMQFDLPENDLLTIDKLSMKYLSDLDETGKAQKLAALQNLVDLYKLWADDLEAAAVTLEIKHQSAAAKNIAACKHAYTRMCCGIHTLETNETAYAAFALANRAMFMQRVHLRMQSQMANADRYPGDAELSALLQNMDYRHEADKNCTWRPFQLAFLLMDINSIVYDDSEERNVVDLIWFPTGGGKTEAYLGLTAFTIFHRKLAHSAESNGTAVIMRYTLRLLAAQQFTRAATLICACEYIRRDCEMRRSKYPAYPIGKTPITVGLWLGNAHIPNKNSKAGEHLKALLGVKRPGGIRDEKEKHNKFQVLKCPWCGTKLVKDEKNKKLIGEWGYKMTNGNHFSMFCPHDACDFTDVLPVQIIDEELYKAPPTLLFGTVDKFAMLPWNGDIGAFFAAGSDNRSPELIIQDELHLISGALGTMVGLYETAIDAICGQKSVHPKVIASTATIRRAKEQCAALYDRDVVQFPAPGLDADDSFFAREAKISYKDGVFGRMYAGIIPSGKTKAMMQIRTIAALLQEVFMMELPDEVKDKLWTLTVYFGSLKELGQTSAMVGDDVKDFITRITNRKFTARRMILSADELTSRVTTTELNETLDKLEKLAYSKENLAQKRYASSILLATNMISVGIDVARLNVMLMAGQPKLTSEYIQASSRVGRSFPGVVFVQYDATKSRDRSHFEGFKAYHESFYRFVEPTGVTPFSAPARERALHAIVIAMVRQRLGFRADEDANRFDRTKYSAALDEIKSFIVARAKSISERIGGELKDDAAEIGLEIDKFFHRWQNEVEIGRDNKNMAPIGFGYKHIVKQPAEGERRLMKPYAKQASDFAIETLTSMRNVDAQIEGEVLVWEE